MFPEDPKIWVTDLAPVGALQARLEANRIGPLPSYMTDEVSFQPPPWNPLPCYHDRLLMHDVPSV